jgi:Zn-finger nucleic acid-binding protein
MNCPNCAAAMELVESRRYFRCGHCGTFHFPTSIEADGIEVVGTATGGPDCPVCKCGMAHALIDKTQPIDFCNTCRGVLLPRRTFAVVITKRRAWATDPPAEPTPLNREDLNRELSCPKCGGRFETYPNYGPGNVVIDSCTTCDVVWLDFGEMRTMVDAPGRDRGSRQVPRLADDYVPSRPVVQDEDGFTGVAPVDAFSLLISVLFED